MTAFDELARLGVATVHEALGKGGLVDLPLVQVVPGSRAAGPARTALCGAADNLMAHAAVAHAQPGDVLVLTMTEPAPVALVGDLLATQALRQGVAALLVDGAVRDVEELRRLGLPVWARWVRARGATKEHVGELDVPVVVGGAGIEPGDVVVLDADGAVVVPAARVDEVTALAQTRERSEVTARERYLKGELSYDTYGLRAMVEKGRLRVSHEYPIQPVASAPDPIGPGVRIGHVHLRTADTARVRAFYVDILGFDVIAEASDVPGWGTTGDVLFVSAGGYHHHLAFNTWKSKDGEPSPDGYAGLHHVAIAYPTRRQLADAYRRLVEADWPIRTSIAHSTHDAIYLLDPDGNTVELMWDRPVEEWPLTPEGHLGADPGGEVDLDGLLRELDEPES